MVKDEIKELKDIIKKLEARIVDLELKVNYNSKKPVANIDTIVREWQVGEE